VRSVVELALRSLIAADFPDSTTIVAVMADNAEGTNKPSGPMYPTSNMRIEDPAEQTTASLITTSPLFSRAWKYCEPPPGQESDVSSASLSASKRRLNTVVRQSMQERQSHE